MKATIAMVLIFTGLSYSSYTSARDESGAIGAELLREYFCSFIGGCHHYRSGKEENLPARDIIREEIQNINHLDLSTSDITGNLKKYLSQKDIDLLKYAPRTVIDSIAYGDKNYIEWNHSDKYNVKGIFKITQIGFGAKVKVLCVKFSSFIQVKNQRGWQYLDESASYNGVLCNYNDSLILTADSNIEWLNPLK